MQSFSILWKVNFLEIFGNETASHEFQYEWNRILPEKLIKIYKICYGVCVLFSKGIIFIYLIIVEI